MGEERQAVIQIALRGWWLARVSANAPIDWSDASVDVERAVAEWERSREPTDAELDAALDAFHGSSEVTTCSLLLAALRAARDVREITDE